MLAKLCNALASRKVNIVAFEASTAERRIQVHLVVDNLSSAKSVLDAEGLTHTENDVVATLRNRPGELAHVAGRLGEANINIDYAYAGIEPSTNVSLLFFGVREVARAARLQSRAEIRDQVHRADIYRHYGAASQWSHSRNST